MLEVSPQDQEKQLPNFQQRLKKLRGRLIERNLDSFLVSSPANKYYLTGWQADLESGFVFLTLAQSYIITDSRYSEHAVKDTKNLKVIEASEGIGPQIEKIAKEQGVNRLGFESHHLSVFALQRLRKFLKGKRLVPVAHLIEEIRAVKNNDEIENIRKTTQIADKAFTHILNFTKPGLTERQVALELETYMRALGAQSMAWNPFIVAAGVNSSMPHWAASEQRIKVNDMVLVDYGCVYERYNCDITRVFFLGKPTKEQRETYELVLNAQEIGIASVKEGAAGAAIDKKVREFLSKSLKNTHKERVVYRHGLGHGVGLEVHELPGISARSKTKLKSGNVITIEPGIYIPGWGGLRIEDMVLVSKNGGQVLTRAPKELKDIII